MITHPAGEGGTAFEFGFNGGGFRVERGCRQLTVPNRIGVIATAKINCPDFGH